MGHGAARAGPRMTPWAVTVTIAKSIAAHHVPLRWPLNRNLHFAKMTSVIGADFS